MILFDSVTRRIVSPPLTFAHRIVAGLSALAIVGCVIVLPWSLAAGAVKHGKANRNKENHVEQGIEHDHA